MLKVQGFVLKTLEFVLWPVLGGGASKARCIPGGGAGDAFTGKQAGGWESGYELAQLSACRRSCCVRQWRWETVDWMWE